MLFIFNYFFSSPVAIPLLASSPMQSWVEGVIYERVDTFFFDWGFFFKSDK